MCLAIPMQVVRRGETLARCSASGIECAISLHLQPPESNAGGDFVAAHVVHAIQKIFPEDACGAARGESGLTRAPQPLPGICEGGDTP